MPARWLRSPLARFGLRREAQLLSRLKHTLGLSPDGGDLDELPFVEDDELRLRVACALVIDAQHGWPAEHRLDARALWVWEWYHSTPVQFFRYLNVIAYLLIAYGETPGWCYAADGSLLAKCSNATALEDHFETSGWHVLPHASALGLETICLGCFGAQLAARLFIMGVPRFLRSRWHALQLLLLVLMVLDVGLAASPILWHRTHFTRPMRAIFVVCSHRKLRDTSAAMVLMMPRMLELLALLVALILFFSWMATLLFSSSPWQGANDGFETFPAAVFSLSMLLTSTNFPDVALPAYRANGAAMAFFIFYQIACVFCGLNLVLALVYRSYCAHMRAEALQLSRNRRHALHSAYRQLCGSNMPSAALSSLALTHANFAQLMHRLRPDLLPWQVGLCFEALDQNQRGVLELREFEAVLSALQVQFESPPSASHVRRHRLRLKLRTVLADWRTKLALDGAVALNAMLIALQSGADHEHMSCGMLIGPQVPFLLLWLATSALHVGAFGWVRGLLLGWNGFDGVLTICGFASLPVLLATGCHPNATWSQALRAFMLLRLLRLLRLLSLSARFRLLLSAMHAMRTPFGTFCGLLLAHLYFFAACGIELLGGVWHRDATCLDGTEFQRFDYYATNFNDFPSAVVTTWTLLMVNNYGVYAAAGYECVGHKAYVFFGLFYFTLVFLIINLLTSFVLESVLSSFDRADAAQAAAAEHAAARAAAQAAAAAEQLAMDGGAFSRGATAGRATLGGSPSLSATPGGACVGMLALDTHAGGLAPPPRGRASSAQDWQGMQEAAADEAERFAETCAARLRAEGNTALVSVRRPRDDGYAQLVKLIAGQLADASSVVQRAPRLSESSPSGSRSGAAGLSAPLVY